MSANYTDRYSKTFLENMYQQFYDSSTGLFSKDFAENFKIALLFLSEQAVLGGGAQVYGPVGVTGSLVTSQRIVSLPVALTANVSAEPATIATDASLGNVFTVSITTGSFSAPTNPLPGQIATWQWTNSSTTIPQLASFSVGVGGWQFPSGANATGSPALIPTTPSQTDYLQAIYNAHAGKWQVLRVVQGFWS